MDLGDTLAHHARNDPDDLALVFEDRRLTWAELDHQANRFANALNGLGAEHGEKALLLLDNSVEFVLTYYGLAKLGCVNAPVLPSLAPREVGEIAESLDADFVVMGAKAAEHVETLEDTHGEDTHLIGVGEDHGLSHDWHTLVEATSAEPPAADVSADDELTVKFTSGTTGLPKGCVRTHRNFIMAASIALNEIPLEDEDRAIVATPLAAGQAMSMLTSYIYRGIPTVLLPRFDAKAYLDTVEREEVSVALLFSSVARRVVEHPTFGDADLSSLRLLFTPLISSRELLDTFRDHETFTAGLTTYYGSSEAGGRVAFKKPEEFEREFEDPDLSYRIESVGREGLLMRVDCLDEDQNVVPRGEVGEFAIKGPTVFQGYWDRPKKTDEVFADGWYLTGDLAKKDEDGYLYLRGRKDEMIKTGGINVYPAEVEAVLESHEAVAQAAVVGIPHPDWDEMVVAGVVPAEPVDDAELHDYCASELADHKRPKRIVMVDELPRNVSGKIVKADLKTRLQDE